MSFATCPTSRRSAMQGGVQTSHGAAKGVVAYLCIRPEVCKSRRSGAAGCLSGFVFSEPAGAGGSMLLSACFTFQT